MASLTRRTSQLASSSLQVKWYQSKLFTRFSRHPLALVGVGLVVLFTFVALLAPVLTAPTIATRSGGHNCARDLSLERGEAGAGQLRNPFSAVFWRAVIAPPWTCLSMPKTNRSPLPQSPSAESPMGTLPGGYDVYYGVVWGIRMAFMLGILVSAINFVIGFVVGGLAGYIGGKVDSLLMRVGEVVQGLPSLVFAILFLALLGKGLVNSIIALSLVGWVGYARIIRGDILRVKQLDFVDGAKAIGASHWRIFFKHVIPNSLNSLIVVVSLDIGAIVLTGATLGFVGLGFQLGAADWGQMFAFSRSFFIGPPNDPFKFWFVSFYPGLAMLLFTLAFNFIGTAYQDALEN
jgi:peptide/nickel transport system permease protein